MQAERFRLASGDIATFSAGMLEIGNIESGSLRSYDLSAARGVQRNGLTINVEIPGHGHLALEARRESDGVAIERALRTAILAAPDASFEDDFGPATHLPPSSSAFAATAHADTVNTPPTSPLPVTPPPAASTPAMDPIVLASGYRVEVSALQIIVRHQIGHVVSEISLGNVQAVGRVANTVTLRTSSGEVNFVAGNEVDAARLAATIDTQRALRSSALPASGTPGTWATPAAAATPHAASGAPTQFTLQSGFTLAVSTYQVVVRNLDGLVVSTLPLAEVVSVTSSGLTVTLRTASTQTNFITTSLAETQRLIDILNTHRSTHAYAGNQLNAAGAKAWSSVGEGTPPPVTESRSSGRPPVWVIIVAVIGGLIIIGALIPDDKDNDASSASRASSPRPTATTRSSSVSSNFNSSAMSEAQYTGEMMTIANEMSSSIDRFVRYTSNPQVLDPTWKANVAVELGIWKYLYAEARDMTPPSRFREVHREFVAGMRLIDSSATKVARGIDTIDADLIDDAIIDMNLGTQHINNANDLLDDLD